MNEWTNIIENESRHATLENFKRKKIHKILREKNSHDLNIIVLNL